MSCKVQSSHTSADHLLSNEKSVIIHPLCVTWNSWLNTKELLTECHVFQATKLQRSPAVKVRCGISFIEGNTTYMFCFNHRTKRVGPSQHNSTPIMILVIIMCISPPRPPPPPPPSKGPCYSVPLLPPVRRSCSKPKKKCFNCELPTPTKLLKI